jgi:hypothetical protein
MVSFIVLVIADRIDVLIVLCDICGGKLIIGFVQWLCAINV